MHTAICSFDDRAQAERTVERLVQAGYDRSDIHLKHRHGDGRHSGTNKWDGMEREVAVDPGVLASFGRFFASLFGKDDASRHADTYASAVERGQYVVIVDAGDDASAMRAQHMMHDMEADNLNVVQRPTQPALRDIVTDDQLTMTGLTKDMADSFGTARSDMSLTERERAMAANREALFPQGPRAGDKDKPNDDR